MSARPPEELIERHEAFLRCAPAERPLIGVWRGGYYPAEQFPRGTSAWREGRTLSPEDVRFEDFADDYEELYRLHREADDDFFHVGSAYWGIPWMEAILGCTVTVASLNCRAEAATPPSPAPDSLDDNPWFESLVRFTRELVAFAGGRFPVCPPLLRGPGDCASAMLGGMSFVLGFTDAPDATGQLLGRCARLRLEVIRRLCELIPPWHGTHAAGGYPSRLWSRRTVAYHQEDSAALLSPDLFRRFLAPLHAAMCAAAEVNFIHLHSACLYPVEVLLEERICDVLQVNIDHAGTGPTLRQIVPVLQRIQTAGVPLILWGEFAAEDWELLRRDLRPAGLSIQPILKEDAERNRHEP